MISVVGTESVGYIRGVCHRLRWKHHMSMFQTERSRTRHPPALGCVTKKEENQYYSDLRGLHYMRRRWHLMVKQANGCFSMFNPIVQLCRGSGTDVGVSKVGIRTTSIGMRQHQVQRHPPLGSTPEPC